MLIQIRDINKTTVGYRQVYNIFLFIQTKNVYIFKNKRPKKFKKIFLRSLKFVSNFQTQEIFGSEKLNFKHLSISIPKCIELNSESKPKLIFFGVWVLGLGTHTQTQNPMRPKPKCLLVQYKSRTWSKRLFHMQLDAKTKRSLFLPGINLIFIVKYRHFLPKLIYATSLLLWFIYINDYSQIYDYNPITETDYPALAWSDLSGLILCKYNLSISLHTDKLNVQLQLHVRISVSKCITKLNNI